MTPFLEDPRIRQKWNNIFQNAESATETAAENIWSLQHNYIHPCFTSITVGIKQCAGQCFYDREDRARRRLRGRAEANFDFYDDWDQDDNPWNQGLLGGWRNDELERLFTGNVSHSSRADGISQPPRRNRGMSYGTKGLRKSLEPDPTVIPSTSALGFLGRLPFKIGSTLRYKPSAADLQDRPRRMRREIRDEGEREPLLGNKDSGCERCGGKEHNRDRSSTESSGDTSDSFRSRRDLFSSDEEDDAVPLGDEFAMALERRIAGSGKDDCGTCQIGNNKVNSAAKTVPTSVFLATPSPPDSKSSLRRQHPSSANSEVDISLLDLQQDEIKIEMKQQATGDLKSERDLDTGATYGKVETKSNLLSVQFSKSEDLANVCGTIEVKDNSSSESTVANFDSPPSKNSGLAFVPAKLPHFN